MSRRRKVCLLERETSLGNVGHPAALLWFQGKLSSHHERKAKSLRTTCAQGGAEKQSEFHHQDKSLNAEGMKVRDVLATYFLGGLKNSIHRIPTVALKPSLKEPPPKKTNQQRKKKKVTIVSGRHSGSNLIRKAAMLTARFSQNTPSLRAVASDAAAAAQRGTMA